MPARRLAATLALAALGSLLAAQAAMAQGRAIDPVQATNNLRDIILAVGGVAFLALMLPCIFLVWKRKYEAAVALAIAAMIPGIFVFAYAVIPAIVRGFADHLSQ